MAEDLVALFNDSYDDQYEFLGFPDAGRDDGGGGDEVQDEDATPIEERGNGNLK